MSFRCEDKDCPRYGYPLTDDFVCRELTDEERQARIDAFTDEQHDERIKWSGTLYGVLRHGKKHVVCPICGREWLTGRPGGGQVKAGAQRHVKACIRVNIDDMPKYLRAVLL